MLSALKQVLGDKVAVVLGVVSGVLIRYIGMLFLDLQLVIGNLGYSRALAEIILHVLLTLLFVIFIASTVYKFRRFHTIKPASQASQGSLGGFLGLIVTGCSSCSITLATYLGIGALLIQLPFHGLEIKVLGVFLLARATRDTLLHINTCAIKKPGSQKM